MSRFQMLAGCRSWLGEEGKASGLPGCAGAGRDEHMQEWRRGMVLSCWNAKELALEPMSGTACGMQQKSIEKSKPRCGGKSKEREESCRKAKGQTLEAMSGTACVVQPKNQLSMMWMESVGGSPSAIPAYVPLHFAVWIFLLRLQQVASIHALLLHNTSGSSNWFSFRFSHVGHHTAWDS
jgi:hypothetical protein